VDELICDLLVEIARRDLQFVAGLINKNAADVFIARPVRKLRAGFGF
jgi:hypothetical protein